MNQKELIHQCIANNYASQLQVYSMYKNMLYNSCIRILKRREDAEDIVQDAFIKGFQKMSQVQDDVNLGAWLRRIAINASLDKIRKDKRAIWLEEAGELEAMLDDVDFDDVSEVSIDFIKECIYELKEKYRVILILYLIEDYNHREISEQLQLKESTVRNQYIRGKEQLLKKIRNINKDETKDILTAK